jgi:hypothetical protein
MHFLLKRLLHDSLLLCRVASSLHCLAELIFVISNLRKQANKLLVISYYENCCRQKLFSRKIYTSSGDKLKVGVLLSRVERDKTLGEIDNAFPTHCFIYVAPAVASY